MYSVLIADPNIHFIDRSRKILESHNYRVIQALDDQEASLRLSEEQIDFALLNIDLPKGGGVIVADKIRSQASSTIPIGWIIPQGRQLPEQELLSRAEGVLIKPVCPKELWTCLHHLKIVGQYLSGQSTSRRTPQRSEPASQPAGGSSEDLNSPLYPISWFRKLAALEVKRALRFQQPLSLILIAFDFDPVYKSRLSNEELNYYSNSLAEAVGVVARDIDIPVQFSQEHILILMPNTDVEGAILEATRIKEELSKILREKLYSQPMIPTISIGVTTSSAREAFKFTDLLRDASRALKEARAQGGDSVFFC